MNSVLQCIFATAPLSEFFIKEFSSSKKIRRTLLSDAYYDLLLSSRKGGVIAPTDLKYQVSRTAR